MPHATQSGDVHNFAKMRMMMLVDFHMHTTTSDGVWTPDELVRYAQDAELQVVSVTDHDTMGAYPLPGDIRARIVPGMEVDTKCNGITAHLLVYGITSPTAPLLEHLRAQREARFGRMEAMVERLRGSGIQIDMSHVKAEAGSAASLGRPHLARALVKLGVVRDTNEAFARYIADDRDGYVSLDRLEAKDAIDLAHASGAIVSVAHPARLRDPGALEELRRAGADGVEVVHPSADAGMRTILTEYAHAHNLLITGGSDFHSPDTDAAPGVRLDEAVVERFLAAVASGAVSDPKYGVARMDAMV
jgi:predicted metal-dependent phosphoesterase TrpH